MLAGSVGSTFNSTSRSFPRTTVASSTQGLRLAIIQYDNRYCKGQHRVEDEQQMLW